MVGRAVALASLLAGASLTASASGSTAPAPPEASLGTYAWPVAGPVLRPFEAPASPYGSGHRGIDIGCSHGQPVRASQAGVVAFAGGVAGSLHVSVDHPDGVRTSYSFLASVDVRVGDTVARGGVLGGCGDGHPVSAQPHLHLGARFAGEYIDPMLLLERRSVVGLIHLAPLEEGSRETAP